MKNQIENNQIPTTSGIHSQSSKENAWEKYSTLHDSFAEILSYERGRSMLYYTHECLGSAEKYYQTT